MEAKITTTELELDKLKRAASCNKLDIKFISYTRLQPNAPLGSSEAEVTLTYNNAAEVFKLGYFFAKEPTDYQMGKITINFP